MRIKCAGDILAADTDPFFDPTEPIGKQQHQHHRHKNQEPYYDQHALDFIEHLIQKDNRAAFVQPFSDDTHLTLLPLQCKGTWNCGFTNISLMTKQDDCFPIYNDEHPFLSVSSSNDSNNTLPIFPPITKNASC